MSDSRDSRRPVGPGLLRGLILLAVYFVFGRLCLRLAVVHPSASAVWAPTGIAIAALLVGPVSLWPAIFAGAFLVNRAAGSAFFVALGIAAGNTLEAVVAALLVRHFAGGVRTFDRAPGVFRYVVFSAGGAAISAIVGVASLVAGGAAPVERFAKIVSTWWLGDLSGALVVGPAIVLWAAPAVRPRGIGRGVELAAMLAAIVLVSWSLFGPGSPIADARLPVQYVLLPVCLWAALRLGSAESATACLVGSAVALWGTIGRRGVFASNPLGISLVLLQTYMAVITVTTLVVAALVGEREEAARVRDEFLSIAGHELRNPLSALVLQVESLARAADRSDAAEKMPARIPALRRTAARLASLVDGLLNAHRVMSGVWPVQEAELDLAQFARDEVADFAERQGLPPEQVLVRADGPLWCRTDPERLEYAFQNLLSNAVKYGLGRPIEVEVGRSGASGRVAVRDHGTGIPAEDQERIFERFERASPSPTGGFGLGLWIVRQAADAVGGKVRVRSRVGEGSEFEIELPLSRNPMGAP